MVQSRIRKKTPTPAPKKRAPRRAKYGAPDESGNLKGPLKASDEIIRKTRERKSEPGDPVPDDFFLDEEDDDKARVIAKYKEKIRNPMTAVRAHCVECMGGYVKEVEQCTSPQCSLYPFRGGKNPFHTRTYTTKPIPPHQRKKKTKEQ